MLEGVYIQICGIYLVSKQKNLACAYKVIMAVLHIRYGVSIHMLSLSLSLPGSALALTCRLASIAAIFSTIL